MRKAGKRIRFSAPPRCRLTESTSHARENAITAKMAKPAASPPPVQPSAPSKEELAEDEKRLANEPRFALDGDEVLEPGSDPDEPPPFDDEPPKRAKARGRS